MTSKIISTLVVKSYVERFLSLASSFLDIQTLLAANATYAASELYDSRRPRDLSRRTGIGPNCALCDAADANSGSVVNEINTNPLQWLVKNYGVFEDYKTGTLTNVKDYKFTATHIFRFLGFVLYQRGFPCSDLYVAGVKNDIYGQWEDNVCD